MLNMSLHATGGTIFFLATRTWIWPPFDGDRQHRSLNDWSAVSISLSHTCSIWPDFGSSFFAHFLHPANFTPTFFEPFGWYNRWTSARVDASLVGLRSLPGLWPRQDWRMGYPAPNLIWGRVKVGGSPELMLGEPFFRWNLSWGFLTLKEFPQAAWGAAQMYRCTASRLEKCTFSIVEFQSNCTFYRRDASGFVGGWIFRDQRSIWGRHDISIGGTSLRNCGGIVSKAPHMKGHCCVTMASVIPSQGSAWDHRVYTLEAHVIWKKADCAAT